MKPWTVLLVAVALSGCSGPVAPTSATSVPSMPSTPPAVTPSTAAAAPSPSEPTTRNLGIVWASAVDDSRINQSASTQPTYKGTRGIVTRVSGVLYIDASESGEMSEECASQIQDFGKASDTHCLLVQWSMDVPSNYHAETADIFPGVLLTPKGRQIDQAIAAEGMPGAKDVSVTAWYPGATPGSTVRWQVGSDKWGRKMFTYKIPSAAKFQPINFS